MAASILAASRQLGHAPRSSRHVAQIGLAQSLQRAIEGTFA
ncbi:MAG: hypothetical protein ACYDD3_02525 [Vulcanimicrobiaceae bacterium]